MKTIVYLVTPPEGSESLMEGGKNEAAEKIKRLFLPEKITGVYAYPGPAYRNIGHYAFGSRGFDVTEYPQLQSADTPDKARQTVRSMMGLNLGKMIAVFVPKGFVNSLLEALGSKDRITKDGSVTTVILTWDREMKVRVIDRTDGVIY